MPNLNQTGYPSIDKPWLKYFNEDDIIKTEPKCTVYDNIYHSNKDHLNEIALMFFGKKITYKELFLQIDKTAKALISIGVKNNDNVAICMPALPETVYTILALNKIGANANMLNPLFNESQLTDRINETEATLLIVANELYGRVEKVIPQTAIRTVVACPAVNSLGAVIKAIKKVKCIDGTISWNEFIKQGKNATISIPEYQTDKPAIMVYSSGTTGASKGIQLTNDSINSTINEGVQIGFPWEREDRWFSQIPIWFSTGICAQTLVPLKYGITIILEPLYDFDILYQHILKYKPNFMITACGLLDYLMSKQPKAEAYKGFKFLCAGGEYVTQSAETKYNNWLKANGNNYGLYKGYGMCECGGTVTASSPKCNAIGSAGIPTPNVIVAAFDTETNQELKYGERGEIRVLTAGRMLGYYKNEKATNDYFYTDENGNVWACTGDMGYVTEDGNLYVDGRISDSYINNKSEIIYLFDIERAILNVEKVRQCKAVVSEIDNHKIHVAHISFDKGADIADALKRIKVFCQSKLKANHIPTLVKIYEDALPVSPSGKLNISEMQNNTVKLIEL